MKNKRLIIILIVISILLLIPFVAMQFTNEVNWTLMDFIIAGFLLLGTGIMCEIVLKKITNIKCRIVVCVLLILIFLLIWAELAVGIIGTPFAGS